MERDGLSYRQCLLAAISAVTWEYRVDRIDDVYKLPANLPVPEDDGKCDHLTGPPGWNNIPGARGCTPQSCAFRDHHEDLQLLDATVYGLSTQTTDYQKELAARLHLPFDVLSDADLRFANALRLPTFTVQSMTLIKRLTLIAKDGVIKKIFYPVFPPDKNPDEVIDWLSRNSRP
jgi:peroxiredoxin